MRSLLNPLRSNEGQLLGLPSSASIDAIDDRIKMIRSYQALKHLINIYTANPNISLIKFGLYREFDANWISHHTYIRDLKMKDLEGRRMNEFTIENIRYDLNSESGSYGPNDLIPYCEYQESYLDEAQKDFSDLASRFSEVSVSRASIKPFLKKRFSFDDAMKAVFQWSPFDSSNLEDDAITK